MSGEEERHAAEGRPEPEAGEGGNTSQEASRSAFAAGSQGPGEERSPVAGSPDPLPQAEPEYRLSPLTVITAPIRYLKSFIVPIAVALVAGNFNPWVLGSSAAVLLGMLVTGFVTWRTFRYRVGAQRLEIRKGLLNRSRRTIPLERIRGVDVTSTLLHRLLGLAVVKVEAAAGGGSEEEGRLDAVPREEAERLRDVLLHRRAVLRGEETPGEAGAPADHAASGATVPEDGNTPETDGSHDVVYFSMPPGWYLYAVLSLGYLLTPFAALAALIGFVGQIGGDLGVDVADEAADLIPLLMRDGAALLTLIAIAGVVTLILLMPVFAVVTYTVGNWGFTLRRRDQSLVTERGLFTRQSVTLEHRRIRGHELIDNPLERLRRAVRLRAIVTGLGDVSTRAALLPIGPRERVHEVVEAALTPYRGTLTPHPPAARSRRLFRAIVPFLALGAAAALADLPWVAAACVLVALLGVPLGLDRYRSLGHGYDGRQVSVRSGSLRREQSVVRRDAIIGWKWSSSPFQRRAGLATLRATVGAGRGGYDAIDVGFAASVAFAQEVTPEMVRPFLAEGDADGGEPPLTGGDGGPRPIG
ncbi:PH domain-containing protein [Marinactinospora thermotolerans]|uniref:Putative membrane protein n=1 Tax=Marinactinospora thermotolerans DSM 45154 TaxID=1122192 RepID=A0A1T4S548_9ACTN|nr:PH domain-containing protein [Marinactinospora thermotolerans]SKA23409.1 putative membrane protein [Marinactinospora thermotolerans DSM 45154]